MQSGIPPRASTNFNAPTYASQSFSRQPIMPTSSKSYGAPQSNSLYRLNPSSKDEEAPPEDMIEEGSPTRLLSGVVIFSPYVCEYVGTLIVAFTYASMLFSMDVTWNATAMGSILIVTVYATGYISGGHLNPAVSVTLGLLRKVRWHTVCIYVCIQIFAGITAMMLAHIIFGGSIGNFMVEPVHPFRATQATIVEMLFTTLLCFVAANCTASKRNDPTGEKNQFFALAIGFSLVAGFTAASNVSGAIFNPAISIGLGVVRGTTFSGFVQSLLYTLYQFFGAALAAFLFGLVRPEDYEPMGDDDLHSFAPSPKVKLLCECLGAFFITFTFCLCTIMESGLLTGWATAAVILSMVYATGNITCHFNPAVTLSVLLSCRDMMSICEAALYMFFQFLGGATSGILVSYLHGHAMTAGYTFGLCPKPDHTWRAALSFEAVFTFLIAFCVLSVTIKKHPVPPYWRTRSNYYFGLAIGMAFAVGSIASGSVSGGINNPAIALGLAVEGSVSQHIGNVATITATTTLKNVSYQTPRFLNFFNYILVQMSGGAVAAVAFRCTHPHEYV